MKRDRQVSGTARLMKHPGKMINLTCQKTPDPYNCKPIRPAHGKRQNAVLGLQTFRNFAEKKDGRSKHVKI